MSNRAALDPDVEVTMGLHVGEWLVDLLAAGVPYVTILGWVDTRMPDNVANILARARYDDEDDRAHLERLGRQVAVEIPVPSLPSWAVATLPAALHEGLTWARLDTPLAVLAASPDYRDQTHALDHLAAAAGSPVTDEATAIAAALAHSPHDFIRIQAAGCSAASETTLVALAKDPDPLVRTAVAGNAAATLAVAAALEAHPGTRTRRQGAALRARLARHPAPPGQALSLAADSAVAEFAASPNPDERLLDRIAAFPHRRLWRSTCLALAANTKTPDAILYSLAHARDEDAHDGDILVTLASNTSLTDDIRSALGSLAPAHRRGDVEHALERTRGY